MSKRKKNRKKEGKRQKKKVLTKKRRKSLVLFATALLGGFSGGVAEGLTSRTLQDTDQLDSAPDYTCKAISWQNEELNIQIEKRTVIEVNYSSEPPGQESLWWDNSMFTLPSQDDELTINLTFASSPDSPYIFGLNKENWDYLTHNYLDREQQRSEMQYWYPNIEEFRNQFYDVSTINIFVIETGDDSEYQEIYRLDRDDLKE